MAIDKDSNVFFNVRVYRENGMNYRTAECDGAEEGGPCEVTGGAADLHSNHGTDDTPQDALAQPAADELTDEAREQIGDTEDRRFRVSRCGESRLRDD